MPSRPPCLAVFLLATLLTVSLAACGGGGGALHNSGGTAGLAITTTTLPGASTTGAYSTTLVTTNAQGPVTWSLTAGALPPGLDLGASSGVISGTATTLGTYDFTVQAEDDVTSATRPLRLTVADLGLHATAGLVFGDAWTNTPVSLSTNGQTGSVSFSIVSSGSGGSFSGLNPSAGTATWTPGTVGGPTVTDRLRATDAANGQTFDLDLGVMVDPTASHVAGFGSSDVWWVDTASKTGAHAFTTDYHKALADIGLRAPGSTGATGTEADDLAAMWFRVALLRRVNPMFLRNADGSVGTGLAITFPFTEPGTGFTKPAAGAWFSGAPTRYSQMAITEGSQSGVIGTAFLDAADNGSHENNTTAGSVELGIFMNQITGIFNNAYGNTLDNNPITVADVPALKALLYELPSPGGRYNLIRRIGQGFAKTIAAVVAHEVGHSLSLDHTTPSQPGSIMNASALISPQASYAFTSADITALQAALPGAGKSTGGQTASQKVTAGGIGLRICRCRAEAAHR